MVALGHLFAERLNLAKGRVIVAVPTQGLSIPNVLGGVFWNPESDKAFLDTLKAELRDDIPVLTFERHVNDPVFGVEVGNLFATLLEEQKA